MLMRSFKLVMYLLCIALAVGCSANQQAEWQTSNASGGDFVIGDRNHDLPQASTESDEIQNKALSSGIDARERLVFRSGRSLLVGPNEARRTSATLTLMSQQGVELSCIAFPWEFKVADGPWLPKITNSTLSPDSSEALVRIKHSGLRESWIFVEDSRCPTIVVREAWIPRDLQQGESRPRCISVQLFDGHDLMLVHHARRSGASMQPPWRSVFSIIDRRFREIWRYEVADDLSPQDEKRWSNIVQSGKTTRIGKDSRFGVFSYSSDSWLDFDLDVSMSPPCISPVK